MAACDSVIATSELLEKIILHLPLQDILLNQRVSSLWRAIIQESPQIQRVLFMKPSSAERLDNEHQTAGGDAELTEKWWTTLGREFDVEFGPVLNPFMQKYAFRKDYTEVECIGVSIVHKGFINPTAEDTRNSVLHVEQCHSRNASWRKMLFSQPPMSCLRILCNVNHLLDNDHRHEDLDSLQDRDENCFRILNGNGLSMGDVVKGIREHWFICPHCPSTGFWQDCWVFVGDEPYGQARLLGVETTGREMLAHFDEVTQHGTAV